MKSVSSRVPRVALSGRVDLSSSRLLVHKDARRSEKQAIDELEVQSMSHKTYHRIGHGISKNKGSFGQPTWRVSGRSAMEGSSSPLMSNMNKTSFPRLVCVPWSAPGIQLRTHRLTGSWCRSKSSCSHTRLRMTRNEDGIFSQGRQLSTATDIVVGERSVTCFL